MSTLTFTMSKSHPIKCIFHYTVSLQFVVLSDCIARIIIHYISNLQSLESVPDRTASVSGQMVLLVCIICIICATSLWLNEWKFSALQAAPRMSNCSIVGVRRMSTLLWANHIQRPVVSMTAWHHWRDIIERQFFKCSKFIQAKRTLGNCSFFCQQLAAKTNQNQGDWGGCWTSDTWAST